MSNFDKLFEAHAADDASRLAAEANVRGAEQLARQHAMAAHAQLFTRTVEVFETLESGSKLGGTERAVARKREEGGKPLVSETITHTLTRPLPSGDLVTASLSRITMTGLLNYETPFVAYTPGVSTPPSQTEFMYPIYMRPHAEFGLPSIPGDRKLVGPAVMHGTVETVPEIIGEGTRGQSTRGHDVRALLEILPHDGPRFEQAQLITATFEDVVAGQS